MRFKPVFKGPIEGYVVNQLKANFWRVEASMTQLDVLQEAYLVFMRCCRHFPVSPKFNTPEAFMALFKVAWRNQFTDLARYNTKHRCVINGSTAGDYEDIDLTTHLPHASEQVGSTDNDGLLSIMIEEAPREVRMVLQLFLNAPPELLESAFGSWKSRGHNNAGGSKHLAKLLGLPQDSDPIQMVRDYFH